MRNEKSYAMNGTSYAPTPEPAVDPVDELERLADTRAAARKRLNAALDVEDIAAKDLAKKSEAVKKAQKDFDEASAALVKAAKAV